VPRPQKLTVTGVAICMDGGTVMLSCSDEAGGEHSVKLISRMNPHSESKRAPDWLAGRLYFDGELVAVRSEIESAVLALLREALPRERDELNQSFIARVIDYVASDEYVQFIERVARESEMMQDVTAYTVWIDSDPETRNRTIVTLARVEGIKLPQAREFIDGQKPLAKDISAPEVAKIFEKYAAAGLTLRVVPPFPWPLNN
jgi:hypothetical protein